VNRHPTAPRGKQKLTAGKKAVFALITVVLIFAAMEGLLRLAGFEYDAVPKYMTFHQDKYMFPDAKVRTFERDDDLFWRLAPDHDALGVNAQGFRGPPFVREKAPGTKRLLCLGCSVTFGLHEPRSYTSFLEERLNEAGATAKYEVYNLGVPGYSTFQGLKLLKMEGLRYAPDLITVLFGWNDHWLMKSRPDKEQTPPSSAAKLLGRSRVYQGLLYLFVTFKESNWGGEADPEARRVSLEDYAANLATMAGLARDAGVPILFITAPSAIVDPRQTPSFLLEDGLIAPSTDLPALHEAYNNAVRKVAAEEEVTVAECALALKPMIHRCMMEDGIHPNEEGHRKIAEIIHQTMRKHGLE
jgi:lysophospholipase L1-like esterase